MNSTSETNKASLTLGSSKLRVPFWALFAVTSIVSTGISFGMLLITKEWLDANGISYGIGCEGPELMFGFLTGILQILQLRFLDNSETNS